MTYYLCLQLHNDWFALNWNLSAVQNQSQTIFESLCWTSKSMLFQKCPEIIKAMFAFLIRM